MGEMPEQLLTEDDAAEFLRTSARTLERYRVSGTGPAFVKLSPGRSGPVRYLRADIFKWISDRRQQSTSSAAA